MADDEIVAIAKNKLRYEGGFFESVYGTTDGVTLYSDDYKFAEDQRAFKIKPYEENISRKEKNNG